MPTILRKHGHRFHFFSGDGNEPPHIYVDGNGRKAKIWLNDLTIAKSQGFTEAELRRINKTVSENQSTFMEAWNEFFA